MPSLIDLTIITLRACLPAGIYGAEDDGSNPSGARVFAAIDLDEIMDGEPKPTGFPSVYVIPGATIVTDPVEQGGNETVVFQLESIVVAVEMDASADEWGHAVALQIQDHKTELLKCLHGWSPTVTAKCLGIDLGYCPKKMAYNADVPFDKDANRYIHQYQFVVASSLDAKNNGFGGFNACNLKDLKRIYADYELSTVIDDDNPAMKSRNDL